MQGLPVGYCQSSREGSRHQPVLEGGWWPRREGGGDGETFRRQGLGEGERKRGEKGKGSSHPEGCLGEPGRPEMRTKGRGG